MKRSLDWIRVEKIGNPSDKKMYQAKLHDAEVEVMILAQEGVLLKAKKAGIIPEIAPVLEEIKKNGFYVSEAVEPMVLREAEEV